MYKMNKTMHHKTELNKEWEKVSRVQGGGGGWGLQYYYKCALLAKGENTSDLGTHVYTWCTQSFPHRAVVDIKKKESTILKI